MTTDDSHKLNHSRQAGWPDVDVIFRGKAPGILGLHGFTGGPGDFIDVAEQLGHHFMAPYLLGHGPNWIEEPTLAGRIDEYADFVAKSTDKNTVLLGYSMGARVALDALLRKRHTPKALVLISGTAGLTSREEKQIRYQQDLSLSRQLTDAGVDKFLESWRQHPLISTQTNASASLRQRMASIRLQHSAFGLAHALKTLSPGQLPGRWDQLHQLTLPVLLITGRLDTKYHGLAEILCQHIPHAKWHIIDDAGHAPHLEKPGPTADVIRRFISSI